MATDGMNGMDISNTEPTYDSQFCPCEACNDGEYRASEMCQGCELYNSEGEPIDG